MEMSKYLSQVHIVVLFLVPFLAQNPAQMYLKTIRYQQRNFRSLPVHFQMLYLEKLSAYNTVEIIIWKVTDLSTLVINENNTCSL